MTSLVNVRCSSCIKGSVLPATDDVDDKSANSKHSDNTTYDDRKVSVENTGAFLAERQLFSDNTEFAVLKV